MKKLFLIVAVAFFGFTNVNAQEVTFGAKAGLNLSTITGDDTDDLEGRTAFHVGVVAEIAISDQFSVQPELLYSAQGAKVDGENVDINVDYINLPIMAKYYVTEGFSLEAGPQVGFLMSAEFKGGGEELDIKDHLKGIDFGLNLGLGYKMESGLNFGARYNLGLSDANDDPDFFESDSDLKNSVIQLSVGYFF